jgi:hypothetical protein
MPRGINQFDEDRLDGLNVGDANSSNIVSPGIVTDGLVLHLDAGNYQSYPIAGTTWYDLTSGNARGVLTDGPVYIRDGGGAIDFDGTNDYVSISNALYKNQDFSVAFWVYHQTQNKSLVSIVDYSHAAGGTNRNWVIQSSDANTNRYYYFGYFDGTSFQPTLGAGIGVQYTADAWQYITYTKVGTSVRGYRNAVDVYSATAGNANVSYGATNEVLFIGDVNVATPDRSFNGYISNLQLYNRALTPTEVAQNFNALRARFNV